MVSRDLSAAPAADSVEEGRGGEALGAQGHMLVAELCSGPTQPFSPLQVAAACSFPCPGKSWVWGVGRDELALGWTRAGEGLRVEG